MQPAFQLPRLTTLFRHALPRLIEGTLVPVALFYGAMWLAGTWGGIIAALAWCYGAILIRVLLRRRIPAILLLGAVALTVRTITAAVTGSVFAYFLQPTIGTVALACAFLVSVPAGRPLAQRLAVDFVPLPPGLISHPVLRRLFVRITLLWAFVLLGNAALTLWLLLSEPISVFLVSRTVSSAILMGGGVVLSTWWFRRSMRRHGLMPDRSAAAESA